MMNNRARSKSWLCFQTGGSVDESIATSYRKSDSVDESIVTNYKKSRSIPPVYINNQEEEIIPISSKSKRKSSRRALSRIVKTVFFETALRKSKKVQQDPYHTLRNLSDVKSLSRNEEFDSKNSIAASVSSCSSSTITSESSSTSSSSSNLSSFPDLTKSFRSNSSFEAKSQPITLNLSEESPHSKPKNITGNLLSSTHGWYVLLISLLVLTFWGRLFAIVCTSTWLYFVPFRRNISEEEEDDDESEKLVMVAKIEAPEEEEKVVMKSREYRKRVIMEGFLERSHSRF